MSSTSRTAALRLAAGSRRSLLSAARLELEADAISAAVALLERNAGAHGAVIEFPSTTAATAIIGGLTDPDARTRLVGIVCVADAAHLLDDLARDDFLVSARDSLGRPVDHVARASLTVTQIEYASMVVLVGWEAVPTPRLASIMALVSALSPAARLRLDQGGVDVISQFDYGSHQDRAGWMAVLNDEADPHMTDPRVSALHYEQLRPFHPARLSELLMRRFDTGEFGRIVRSAGFCRLASRPGTALQWDHVGRTIAFHLIPEPGDETAEFATVSQDLAFIGLDLDRHRLREALDRAALTDAELTAGPRAWARYPDPFPRGETAGDSAH